MNYTEILIDIGKQKGSMTVLNKSFFIDFEPTDVSISSKAKEKSIQS